MTNQNRSRFRSLASVAALGLFSLIASGCAAAASNEGQDSDNSDSVEGVPYGAPKDEWIAAFEDVEPVTVSLQTGLQGSDLLVPDLYNQMVEDVEEWSGGKVTIELTPLHGIAGALDVDEALADGRLDLAAFTNGAQPDVFPLLSDLLIQGTESGGNAIVSSTLAGFGAINEIAFSTPEFEAELDDAGLSFVTPLGIYSNNQILCREAWTSFDDLAGKQVRVGSAPQFAQIEAMGAIPVSVEFTELSDALQRGIVDCAVFSMFGLSNFPAIMETVPYVISPAGDGRLAYTPPAHLAGSSWETLPLPARQLIFDKWTDATVTSVLGMVSEAPAAAYEVAAGYGGGFYDFDEETSGKLDELSRQTMDSWAENPLLDGAEYTERYESLMGDWTTAVQELGYSDLSFGEFADLPTLNPDAYRELFAERITTKYRPGAEG